MLVEVVVHSMRSRHVTFLTKRKKKKKKNETTEKKEMKKRTGANFGATDCTFSVQSAILSLVSPDSSIQQRPECLNPISI